MNKHKLRVFLILFILLLFHTLNNYYILTKSRYCLGPDEFDYFDHIIQISQTLSKIKLNLKSLYETYDTIFRYKFKPPLFFVTANPFLLFGINKNSIIMSNLLYFAILLFATYGIGKKLYDYKVSILSAFLVSMFPTVFALSRVLMIDFALMAMVALTFYLFVLNKFDSLKFSLLTGVVIGLGALTKQSYFIFLLPILFYFFFQKGNLKNKKIIRNFIFSIILGLFILIPYYIQESYAYYHFTFLYWMFLCKSRLSPYFYLQSMFNRQLLPIFSLLFLISLIWFLLKRKYFLPLMILIILIFFSTLIYKIDRYILPVFPYIAVMISAFICSLSKMRRIAITVLVLFSFLQYFIVCYGNTLPISYKPLQKSLSSSYQMMIDQVGLFFIIHEGDWQSPSEEIINIADNVEKNKMDRRIKILFIGQEWRIQTTIDYLRLIKKLPIDRVWCPEYEYELKPWLKNKNFDDRIIQADFIIIEEIDPKDMWVHTAYLYDAFKRNSHKFNFIKIVPFPNNSLCYVYERKKL